MWKDSCRSSWKLESSTHSRQCHRYAKNGAKFIFYIESWMLCNRHQAQFLSPLILNDWYRKPSVRPLLAFFALISLMGDICWFAVVCSSKTEAITYCGATGNTIILPSNTDEVRRKTQANTSFLQRLLTIHLRTLLRLKCLTSVWSLIVWSSFNRVSYNNNNSLKWKWQFRNILFYSHGMS